MFFTFPHGISAETIWHTIWCYLVATYDLEMTDHIFISGDGVSWMMVGAEYIEGARYVLDGVHLRRAIFSAAGADETMSIALPVAVYNG